MKINYVIATWSGPRRQGNLDVKYYLTSHFDLLQKLSHQLSQVTIVLPHNSNESLEFIEFVNRIPTQIKSTDVVIFRRPNLLLSYGSYSDVFGKYRDQFDYYIFIEDDYVFIADNFDTILTSMYAQEDNCGYLCSYAAKVGRFPHHAAISNGIASTEVLNKIWSKFGSLLSEKKNTSGYTDDGQIAFSNAFLECGFRICDYRKYYRSVFNQCGNSVIYGDKNKPDLIIPIQFLNSAIR